MMKKTLYLLLMGFCCMDANLSASTESTILSESSLLHMNPTNLEYMNDTYCFKSDGTFLGIGRSSKGEYLVFDRTIFYPQGGGQPSDIGDVEFINGLKIPIGFVGFDQGVVHHYFKNIPDAEEKKTLFNNLQKLIGSKCLFSIDMETRMLNAKAHTSGHLIASVAEKMIAGLVGNKGYHFQDNAYVEFEGCLQTLDKDKFQQDMDEALRMTLVAQLRVTAQLQDPSTLVNLHLPAGYKIPEGKPCRLVQIDSFPPVPCGGTHLSSLKDLSSLLVRKIQIKKGVLKISYVFK